MPELRRSILSSCSCYSSILSLYEIWPFLHGFDPKLQGHIVAIVGFFCKVSFQMSSQMTHFDKFWKVTSAAFVWIFSRVSVSQNACLKKMQSHVVWFSSCYTGEAFLESFKGEIYQEYFLILLKLFLVLNAFWELKKVWNWLSEWLSCSKKISIPSALSRQKFLLFHFLGNMIGINWIELSLSISSWLT